MGTSRPKPKGPVAWLLGPQLLATLKQTALYAAFPERLDPRDWMRAAPIPIGDPADGELWFDYIADTGDGQRAVYSVALLCLSDLHADGAEEVLGRELRFGVGPDPADCLHRGQFLFVGGDTAYHVADVRTLKERFVRPFQWACEDLGITDADPRPLLGIPGNHDWYDSIDGFGALFRQPPVRAPGPLRRAGPEQALEISAFRTVQQASYVALDLPFGWTFVGLDAQNGRIDRLQRDFFSGLSLGERDRLIVATPEPSTVFGTRGSSADALEATFDDLGMEAPHSRDGDLPAGKIRLDLSGDIHHYARYWGPDGAGAGTPNYASVVAGLGGAFLHSSETDLGDIEPRAIYPEPREARRAQARELFRFWNVLRGGYVWLFGGVLAAMLYFGALVPDSSRRLLGALVGSELEQASGPLLGWLQREVYRLDGGGEGVLLRSAGLLLTLVGAGLLFALASRLRVALIDVDRRPDEFVRTLSYLPIWTTLAAAVALPFFGMWFFGRAPAAVVLSDLLFLIVLAVPLGLAWAGAAVGAGRMGAGGKTGFALLGFWHGVVQLGTPFLLAWRLGVAAWIAWVVAVPLLAWLGYLLAKARQRVWLTALFVLHGLAILVLAVPHVGGRAHRGPAAARAAPRRGHHRDHRAHRCPADPDGPLGRLRRHHRARRGDEPRPRRPRRPPSPPCSS